MKIIIAGAGEIGVSLAKYLRAENHDIVMIDKEAEQLENLSEQLDIQTIVGSAALPSILDKAGANSADIFLAVTGADEMNIIGCSLAKSIFNIPKRIARISSPEYMLPKYKGFLTNESIDVVVSPEEETATRIVQNLGISGSLDMIPMLDGVVRLLGLRCKKTSPIVGKKLAEIYQNTAGTGFRILALSRRQKPVQLSRDISIKPGDEVYFIVATKDLIHILDIFGYENITPKNIIIFGGGKIGWRLAKIFEDDKMDHEVTIVEKNEERCQFLAENLNNTLIINGDGLDESLTEDLELPEHKIAISTTQDDENNILLSLLSKRNGVERTCALIHNPLYQPLLSSLGVDTTINTNAIMVSSILQYLRKGKVRNDYFLQSGMGEVLELEVLSHSKITQKPLGQIKLPDALVVGGILRGDLFMPYHRDLIAKPGDVMIVYVERGSAKSVEKLFSAGFSFF